MNSWCLCTQESALCDEKFGLWSWSAFQIYTDKFHWHEGTFHYDILGWFFFQCCCCCCCCCCWHHGVHVHVVRMMIKWYGCVDSATVAWCMCDVLIQMTCSLPNTLIIKNAHITRENKTNTLFGPFYRHTQHTVITINSFTDYEWEMRWKWRSKMPLRWVTQVIIKTYK